MSNVAPPCAQWTMRLPSIDATSARPADLWRHLAGLAVGGPSWRIPLILSPALPDWKTARCAAVRPSASEESRHAWETIAAALHWSSLRRDCGTKWSVEDQTRANELVTFTQDADVRLEFNSAVFLVWKICTTLVRLLSYVVNNPPFESGKHNVAGD